MQPLSFSRRRVLQLAGSASGALCWSVTIPAAENVKPLSFVIVTDTHLGRKDNSAAEKNWLKAVAEIEEAPAQFVLHLGDIVDGGRESQYPIYQETRELLNKPIHEIPGNHDPVDLFQKYVSKETDRTFDYGDVRFLLFNNAHRDSHDGFITENQISWLDNQCADTVARKLKVVICCHVPIHANKHPDRGWYVKPATGQKQFYEFRKKYDDRILACLHGHFHNGIRGWQDHGRTAEILCPSVCYNQNRNLTQHISDGTADGFVVDELRPGYVMAELGNGRLVLRYKPLGQEFNGSWSSNGS